MATPFTDLPPFRRWYRFGWRSPNILYRRLRNKHRPIFHGRMMWQRARRGWSVQDAWGFHAHLSSVIADGVAYMRSIAHGHPGEITYEEWLVILDEIEAGMRAALVYENEWEWEAGGEEAFALAMKHLHKWWFSLWD